MEGLQSIEAQTLNPPAIPDRPLQPVDDDLLEPGEYAAACDEARERTDELIAAEAERLREHDPDLLTDHLDGLRDTDCRALAGVLLGSDDADVQAWVRRAFHTMAADRVIPVNEEAVLREWHGTE